MMSHLRVPLRTKRTHYKMYTQHNISGCYVSYFQLTVETTKLKPKAQNTCFTFSPETFAKTFVPVVESEGL
jgi:hypothetical protein